MLLLVATALMLTSFKLAASPTISGWRGWSGQPLLGRSDTVSSAGFAETTAEPVRAALPAAVGGLPAGPAPHWLDVLTPVVLHGRVAKRGPVAYLPMLAAKHERLGAARMPHVSDFQYESKWRLARRRGDPALPTLPHCSILYSDRLGLIFLRSTKTGSTTLLQYFTICPYDQEIMSTDINCLRTLDTSNATEVQHVLKVYESYFVFTFVRNVLDRAVSSYTYIARSMRAAGVPAPSGSGQRHECAVPWDRFCSNPMRCVCWRGGGGGSVSRDELICSAALSLQYWPR